MTRRAGFLALLAGLLAALPLGCGDGDKRSDAQLRGVRLAAVIKGLDNPFFVTMRDGLVATARHDGARLQVAAAPSGLQDTAGQASALETLAGDDPRCYVVNPINQTNLVGALARVAAHTPVVNVDSVIGREAAKAVGVEITTYVGTDNRAGGRLGADAMAALVHRGARGAVITGIPRDVGSAVRAAGRQRQVKVVGFDGIPQALAAVSRGSLSATVAQYPFTMGQLAVEACLAALRRERVPSTVDAPIQVVTGHNVARARANFPR